VDFNTKEQVRKAVLSSGVLGQSEHQKSLFEYLLEYSFSAKPQKIKGYTIAVDIFDRNQDFDGTQDSIVRVEMYRLRANLERFNAKSQTFRLNLEKGSYKIEVESLRPKLQPSSSKDTATNEGSNALYPTRLPLTILARINSLPRNPFFSALSGAILTVCILSLIDEDKPHLNLSAGITGSPCSTTKPNLLVQTSTPPSELEEHLVQLLQGASSQHTHVNSIIGQNHCRGSGTPNYLLKVKTFETHGQFDVNLSLISIRDEDIIASESFKAAFDDFDENNVDPFIQTIRISNDWLKQNSVLHKNAVSSEWKNERYKNGYACLSSVYASFISDSDDAYNEALLCLENGQSQSPEDFAQLGALAASYLEQAQNIRDKTVSDPLKEAQNILKICGDTWSHNVETTVAKIIYESVRPDFNAQRLRNVLLKAETIYPSNPIILSEAGKYYGFRLGDWEKATQLSDRVYSLQSERDNSVFLISAMHHLEKGNLEQAFSECRYAYSKHSVIANLIMNSCAVRTRNQEWVDLTEINLRNFELETIQQRRDFIKSLKFEAGFSTLLRPS